MNWKLWIQRFVFFKHKDVPEPEDPKKEHSSHEESKRGRLMYFFQQESKRYESFGVEPLSLEEIYRCLFVVEFYSSSSTDELVGKIAKILKPKEEKMRENIRLMYLMDMLKQHSKRFQVA